jgi:hypothetical protein
MQRHGDLADTEVRAEMTADLTDGVDDVLAHLLRKRLQFLIGQAVEVRWGVDVLKQVGHL